MGVPLVAGMAVAGAATSMAQAQQKNEQAQKLASNALRQTSDRAERLLNRDSVMRGRIKRKSDQDRLAIARKTAQEAGSRIVAAAGAGVRSDTGSHARDISDALFRGTMLQGEVVKNFITDIQSQRSQTEAALAEDHARLQNILNEAQGMTQNLFTAGLTGAAGMAASGTGIATGLEEL